MRVRAYIVHRAMCAPELEWSKPKDCLLAEPLYAKHEWQGLTDEQIDAIQMPRDPDYDDKIRFARAIEAKLKEKNT